MSFFGGPGGSALGGGQIVIGAQTAGFRQTVHGAVSDFKHAMSQMAGDAEVQGKRTAAGVGQVGTAAERSSAQVTAASRKNAAAMKAGTAEAEASGKRWNAVFNAVGAAAKIGFLGVAAAVGIGVKSAADFEKQWAAVVKTVGGSAPEMAKLREQFLGLAQVMPVSLKDLASIGETAGALGIPTKSIIAFTKVIAEIGATTNVSVDQAATSLGQLGNVLGLRQKDYERFGSTLVDLGNKGASTEKQILDITTRAGAAGKLLGLSTAQILAIASTTASLGINPEAAGTALQRTFIQLLTLSNAQDKATNSAAKLKVAQDTLGVAEKKLTEVRAKKNVTASQIAAAELRVEKATIAVGTASQTGTTKVAALAKAAGMTVDQWKALLKNDPGKAVQSFVDGLGTMTQPQRLALLTQLGLKSANITRTLLGLAASPKELTRQLGIADSAWKANTALQENYAKKTANLIDRLKILGNVIQIALIRAGDMVLPGLTAVVNWLTENIPNALATAGQLWNRFWDRVKEPIGGLVKSFGTLLDALTGGSGGKGMDWAKTFADLLDGVASAVGTIARGLSGLITIGAQFAASPLGQWARNIIVPLLAVSVAVTGLMALAKRLTGGTLGIVKGIAGMIPGTGLLKRLTGGGASQGDTPEAKALIGAGKGLDSSAVALKEAAAKLGAASLTPGQQRALQSAIGGLPGGGEIGGIAPKPLTRPMTTAEQIAYAEKASLDQLEKDAGRYPRVPIGPGTPAYGFGQGGMNPDRLTSVPLASKAEYLANQKAFDNAGKSLVSRAAGSLAEGARAAAGGVKGLAKDAFSSVKGVGSLISKAFWPLLLADMATEFLKQPVSDFIAANTPFKNAAKEMATDFWGGARDLLISALQGTDAWVGHAELTTIGKAKISTLQIAKLGFTSADIGTMQAPTLDNGGYFKQVAAAQLLSKQISTLDAAQIVDEAKKAGLTVPSNLGVAKGFGKSGDPIDDLFKTILDTAGAQPLPDPTLVKPVADNLRDALVNGANDALRAAVGDAIGRFGYSASDIQDLPQSEIDRIGHLIGANAGGKINNLLAYALRNDIQGQPTVGNLLTADQIKRQRQGASGAAATIPFGYLPPGGLSGTQGQASGLARTNRGRSAREGSEGAFAFGPPGALIGAAQITADANAAFKSNLAKFAGPAKATYKQWLQNVANDQTGNRQVAAAAGQQFADRFGKAIEQLGRTGKDTKGFRNIAQLIIGPDAVTRDAKGVEHLADGAWTKVLAIYDDALYASGAGQRAKIAKTMADIIKAGAADGSSDAAAQMTPLFFAENQKAITAALADPKGKALTALLTSYNKANPTAQFGDVAGFKAAYEAWKKTGMLDPTKAGEASMKLSDVHSAMQDVADTTTKLTVAMTNLSGSFQTFLNWLMGVKPPTLGPPVPPGLSRSGGGTPGAHPLAGGGFFDTQGQTHLTVGEAGRETVAVLSNPRRFLFPSLTPHTVSTPSLGGAAVPGGGRTTQIFADKLQVLGPSDEQSLLARFAFLSNQ